MSNPNRLHTSITGEDKNTDIVSDKVVYEKRGEKALATHHDDVTNIETKFSSDKAKVHPNNGSSGKGPNDPPLYASVKPFCFPSKQEYRIISRSEEMERTGKFISPNEVSIRNQAVADERIEYYTSKLAELTPNLNSFRNDAGRDQKRIDYCLSLQRKISNRHSYNNYGMADNDEKMDFAFEGLLYKFVENGLFENNGHKARMIFTSKFDDYVNADGKEEAHATDCAFSVPVQCKNKDGKDVIRYIPIAIAATTSASRRPPKSSRTGQCIIQEKLNKYPKNQAFVEFAVKEDGSHLDASFMPVFVLGFQHDKVREILSTYDDLDKCLTKEIKHNFYIQIMTQCRFRINSLRENSKEDDTQARIAINKYMVLFNNFNAEDKKICKDLNRKLDYSIWNDSSAQTVVYYTK